MKRFRFGMAFAALLIIASLTHAANLTTCNESSLRAALAAGGTIAFQCNGTILVSQQLVVTADTTLDATGRNVLLDGMASSRVLLVQPGVQLRLINLVITNGHAREGGGLYNSGGVVSAENCTFAGNRAVGSPAFGGAIWNSGTLTLTQCVLVQNVARGEDGLDGTAGSPGTSQYDQFGRCRPITPPGNGTSGQNGGGATGGAIWNHWGADLSIVNCALESNTAEGGRGGNGGDGGIETGCWGGTGGAGSPGIGGYGEGGAISCGGTVTVVGSTLAGNVARGGDGGRGGRTSMGTVNRGGNGGGARGGGISNTAYPLAMTNCTVANNQALGGAGGVRVSWFPDCFPADWNAVGGNAEGGGIFNGPIFVAQNVTIWNNEARGGRGGTHTNDCPPAYGPSGYSTASSLSANVDGSTILLNTIVGNLASTNNCWGIITDAGYNICSDGSAAFTNSTSRNGTDPHLANLADNGGPTRTCALLPGSPALDQGDPNNCLPFDQRGARRPAGAACDIGAYEGGPLQLPVWTPAFAPGTISTGEISRFTFTLHNTNPVSLTQIYFTNNFPPGFVIAPVSNKSMDAQGALIAFGGQSRLLGIINTLAAGQSCTVAVDVRGVYAGAWNDDKLPVRSPQIGNATLFGNGPLTILGGAADCNGCWICRLPEGWIRVRLPVSAGETLVLSASDDLQTWTPLRTNTGPGLLEYIDQTAPGTPARFFRAR